MYLAVPKNIKSKIKPSKNSPKYGALRKLKNNTIPKKQRSLT